MIYILIGILIMLLWMNITLLNISMDIERIVELKEKNAV
jgi:hypothetical protein